MKKLAPVLCIGGVTGAGKSTLVEHFLRAHTNFVWVPRVTDRRPRPGEANGLEYRFVSGEVFDGLAAGQRLCAVNRFVGYRYGVDREALEEATRDSDAVVGIFGMCGPPLRDLVDLRLTLVYVTASLQQIEARLRARGTPQEEMANRLAAARIQLEEEPRHFDYVVDNGATTIDPAYEELCRIATGMFNAPY